MQLTPRAGLEIDGFTLGEMLHRGGFATIWEVTNPLYRTPATPAKIRAAGTPEALARRILTGE